MLVNLFKCLTNYVDFESLYYSPFLPLTNVYIYNVIWLYSFVCYPYLVVMATGGSEDAEDISKYYLFYVYS